MEVRCPLSTRQNQDPVPPKPVSSTLIVPFTCLIWCVLAHYNISHIDLNALMSGPQARYRINDELSESAESSGSLLKWERLIKYIQVSFD